MDDEALLKMHGRRCGFDMDDASVRNWWKSLTPERRLEVMHECDLRWVRYSWQADEPEEKGTWAKMAFVKGEKLLREYHRIESESQPTLLDFEELVDWASDQNDQESDRRRRFHSG